MPRVGLTPQGVVDVALTLVDDDGPAALTLAAVAARAGVATPSLYKHVASLADLRELLAARVLEDVTDRLQAVVLGRSGDDAVGALFRAYREYALAHPQRYLLFPQAPMPSLQAQSQRLLDVFVAVLREYGLEGSAAVHATRALRATVHGFVVLEVSGGFGMPEQIEESYEHLTRMAVAGLRALRT